MAANVYGTPVTNETLEGLPQFHDKKPTQEDRARVALEMKNAEGKDVNAIRYGWEVQKRYDGGSYSAIVLIYNATGNPLIYSSQHHWHGRIGDSPVPLRIENGQWGVFVQGQSGKDASAKAGVVYQGKAPSSKFYNWILAWNTAHNITTNEVAVDIGLLNEFDGTWKNIEGKLNHTPYAFKSHENLHLGAAIGNSAATSVEAIFTFTDLWWNG